MDGMGLRQCRLVVKIGMETRVEPPDEGEGGEGSTFELCGGESPDSGNGPLWSAANEFGRIET